MQIHDMTVDLEQSLASLKSLKTSALPPALQGLRHLPMGGYEPRVSICYRDGGRRVRRDADASYFDPDYCDVVIRFVVSDGPDDGDAQSGAGMDRGADDGEAAGGRGDVFDRETAMDELLEALAAVESAREFVGLKWFRDKCLPTGDHDWAGDPRNTGALLRRATEQRLILTSQIPNPNNPLHPVTAIRINRRHPRFGTQAQPRRAGFERVRIRGGAIADTVLGDRR